MNNQLHKIAVENNILNYVDNETPPIYFIHGNLIYDDVNDFSEAILKKCYELISENIDYSDIFDDFDKGFNSGLACALRSIQKYFEVE